MNNLIKYQTALDRVKSKHKDYDYYHPDYPIEDIEVLQELIDTVSNNKFATFKLNHIAIIGIFGINHFDDDYDILFFTDLSNTVKDEVCKLYAVKDRNSISMLVHVFVSHNKSKMSEEDISIDIFYDELQEQDVENITSVNSTFKSDILHMVRAIGLSNKEVE